MKKIEAIIKPFKLDEVREALQEIGSKGLSVMKLRALVVKRGIQNCIEALNM